MQGQTTMKLLWSKEPLTSRPVIDIFFVLLHFNKTQWKNDG
jgi:hypothetical protein